MAATSLYLIPNKNSVHIFTDGACSGNPGRGGWSSVFVFSDQTIQEYGGASSATTNNRMELQGVIETVLLLNSERLSALRGKKIIVFSDSMYVLNGISSWIAKWKATPTFDGTWLTQQGTPVSNQDLWQKLDQLLTEFKAIKKIHPSSELCFEKVKGHSDHPGNDRADEIAVQFSLGHRASFQTGQTRAVPQEWLKAESAQRTVHSNPMLQKLTDEIKHFPVYLILDAGTVRQTNTWKECEALVKGRKNMKFKKVENHSQLAQLVINWSL